MPSTSSPDHVVVRRRMNDHGTMTVERCATNETRHVCAYATADLRRRLAGCPDGETLLLSMSRIGGRGNVWRAAAVGEDDPAEAVAGGSDADGRRRVSP
jgi:hypothetical protein